jgi:hypothetical protein
VRSQGRVGRLEIGMQSPRALGRSAIRTNRHLFVWELDERGESFIER